MEEGYTTTDPIDIRKTINDYYEQLLFVPKFDNPSEQNHSLKETTCQNIHKKKQSQCLFIVESIIF